MNPRVPEKDTIAAAATPPGHGAIGVVRMSGPDAAGIISKIFRGSRDPAAAPSPALLHGIIHENGQEIDRVIVIIMRGPRSYTGEDLAEIQCHGGPVIVSRVLSAVIAAGARPAEPGEFTQRAFINGKLDLSQAEAVCDLIMSRTGAAARAALRRLEGGLADAIRERRDLMAEALTRLEAGIDFAEEEHVEAITHSELGGIIREVESGLTHLLTHSLRGTRLREGARVVIAGKPNVGKSTLMNALLRRERVIVTETPGTTRDLIEDEIEISGMPVKILDTAGLRRAVEQAEKMGVQRTESALASADLCLFLVDASRPLDHEDREAAAKVTGPVILIKNKCDLPAAIAQTGAEPLLPSASSISLSAKHGDGIPGLEAKIAEILLGAPISETPLIAGARQKDAIKRSLSGLERAREAMENKMSDEFIAADLRRALNAIGEITGETAPEEILDRIFSRFCVGK